MRVLFLLLLCLGPGAAQVQRDANSADIQVCASGALSTQRAQLQAALLAQLTTKLASTAVYLDSTYTDDGSGAMCYLFVYQAPTGAAAVQAFEYLNPTGVPSVYVYVQLGGVTVNGTISAAQWTGAASAGGISSQLPWALNDMLLWGSCAVGTLCLCMGATCCYAMRLAGNRDHDELERLLHDDKKVLKLARELHGEKKGHG